MLVQTDLAATLEAIRDLGADAVRTGPIAAAICEAVGAAGGVLTPDDLAQDRVSVEPPATTTFAGATVSGPDFEASGTGVLFPALAGLDPSLLDDNRGRGYVEALAESLRRSWSARLAASGAPMNLPHTTHLCAAGPDGDLATLTFTHGPWFGADLIATGTGVLLNAGANLLAPSAAGVQAVTNMAPVVLDTRDGTRHAFGAAGGPRIPALLLSAIVDIVCFDATLEGAIAAPHLSVRAADGALEVERGLPLDADLAAGSLTLGDRDFGPICGITRTPHGGLVGVPDRRFEYGLATV
jgi:gamma-glutamyltranspeptidase/glutathione hydrolase